MARTSKANSAVATAATDATVAAVDVLADEIVNEVVVNDNSDASVVKEKRAVPELAKDDDIEVVSLIPNVSYKDKASGDIYKWERAGQVEVMSFETLQNMWRNAKGYFRNMWLKPLDERVIKKFGLGSIYDKYDFLMDSENYTKDNIEKICDSIKNTPSSLKLSLCNKVKSMVANGELSNITVIRAIERSLNIDLITLVN